MAANKAKPMTNDFWKKVVGNYGFPIRYQKATLKQCGMKAKDVKPTTYTGDVGSGKTHTLYAIKRHLIKNEREVSTDLINWKHFIDGQRARMGTADYHLELKRLSELKNLLIDDLATEDTSDWTNEIMYSILDNRYINELDTYASTNLSEDELHSRIGDRNFRRLIEMAPIKEVSCI